MREVARRRAELLANLQIGFPEAFWAGTVASAAVQIADTALIAVHTTRKASATAAGKQNAPIALNKHIRLQILYIRRGCPRPGLPVAKKNNWPDLSPPCWPRDPPSRRRRAPPPPTTWPNSFAPSSKSLCQMSYA